MLDVRKPIFDHRITQYNRSILPNLFVAFMDEGVSSPADWIPRTGRSLGHPGWGLIYHIALSVLRPDEDNLIIETGTNIGSTAIMVGQAIKDARRPGEVRTVEIDPDIASEAKTRISLAGVEEFVRVYVGDSLEVLPDILDQGELIRMAFLDGNHFHDHVVREFELIHESLSRDAIVVFDNTYMMAEEGEDPRVNGALRTIVDRFQGNLVNFPICSWYTPGVAIWQRQAFESMDPPIPGSFASEV